MTSKRVERPEERFPHRMYLVNDGDMMWYETAEDMIDGDIREQVAAVYILSHFERVRRSHVIDIVPTPKPERKPR